MQGKLYKLFNLSLSVRDICFIGIFTAFTAVSSQFSIPMPAGVPFTLQTFVIPLAGIILGAKKGALSALVYVILGITGVPVFTGFRGGISVIFGVTGGYILSFPILAFCAGLGSDLYIKIKNTWGRNIIFASGLIIGTAVNYVCGMLMGKFVVSCGMREAFALFVFPYIPTAVIKIILAWIFGLNIKKVLKKIYK